MNKRFTENFTEIAYKFHGIISVEYALAISCLLIILVWLLLCWTKLPMFVRTYMDSTFPA